MAWLLVGVLVLLNAVLLHRLRRALRALKPPLPQGVTTRDYPPPNLDAAASLELVD